MLNFNKICLLLNKKKKQKKTRKSFFFFRYLTLRFFEVFFWTFYYHNFQTINVKSRRFDIIMTPFSSLENGVMMIPKRRLLKLIFACLCFKKSFLIKNFDTIVRKGLLKISVYGRQIKRLL